MTTTPDAQKAIDFLKSILPDGPWCLTVFDPANKRNVITEVFYPETEQAMHAFITLWNGKRNLHYQLNIVKPRDQWIGKRPKKEDFTAINGGVVDVDPDKFQPWQKQLDAIFVMTTEKLPRGVPGLPTINVFSGGGRQLIYKYETPIVLTGDPREIEKFEAINELLIAQFDGDPACKDIGHLMRLPFTWNIPSEDKLKGKPNRPKESTLATVYPVMGPLYTPDQFKPIEGGQRMPARPKKKRFHLTFPADLPTISGPDDLDEFMQNPDEMKKVRLKVIMRYGRIPDDPKQDDDSRSAWVFDFVCNAYRMTVPKEIILAALLLDNDDSKISASVVQLGRKAREYAERQIERAMEFVFIENAKTGSPGQLVLAAWDGRIVRRGKVWNHFDQGCYVELEDEEMQRTVYRIWGSVERKVVADTLAEAVPHCLVPQRLGSAPLWLDGRPVDPRDFIVCRNGMVNIRTGELLSHDDNLFTYNALPIDYDPSAGEPTLFKEFIKQTMHEDCHDLIRYVMADMLSPDLTRPHIYCFIGGGGSGKSTLSGTFDSIYGKHNIASPSIHDFGETNGLHGLIGKRIAKFNDIDVSRNHRNAGLITQRVKQISGGDTIDVGRKFLPPWQGKLDLRMVAFGNGMPNLYDPSEALMQRWFPIEMPFQFRGTAKEDRELGAKLATETSAVIKWLVEARANMPKRLVVPESSRHLVGASKTIEQQFFDQCCVFGPDLVVGKDELHAAYVKFHDADKDLRRVAQSKITFSRTIYSLLSGRVKNHRPKDDDGNYLPREWAGLRLNGDWEVPF